MEPLYSPDIIDTLRLCCLLFLIGVVVSVATMGLYFFTDVFDLLINILTAIGTILIVGSCLTFIFLTITGTNDLIKVQEERIKLMEDTYGISISKELYAELDYPYNKPGAESSYYGTIFVETSEATNAQKIQVTLFWTGKEFQLVTSKTTSTDLKELVRSK